MKAIISATHVSTNATKFDFVRAKGSRRQIRAAARKLAREAGRHDVWLGWNWDGRGAAPLAFRCGKQVR